MSLEIPTSPRRVKVYQLSGDIWVDKGTGFCVGELRDNNQTPYLLVRNEVNSQDILLDSRVQGDTQFHKQQQTMIVWNEVLEDDSDGDGSKGSKNSKTDSDDEDDSSKLNVALSFQEGEGCSSVCDFLVYVQSTLENNISLVSVVTCDDGTEQTELIAGPLPLPPEPTASNLGQVTEALNVVTNQYGRDNAMRYMIENDYVKQLIKVFEEAEETKALDNLHELCRVVKLLFLISDSSMYEVLLGDDYFLSILGMLEYDSDFPNHKANHREYVQEQSMFNEVIPLPSSKIRDKIKQTFRLQFLKDVVLARLLDDSTFSTLSSMIYFNQVDVIGVLQSNTKFLESLFGLFKKDSAASSRKRNDAVRFIHQMSCVAKIFQAQHRTTLYTSLAKNGLFLLIHYALNCDTNAVRVLGTELMVTIIDHDAGLVRNHSEVEQEEESEYGSTIMNVLIKLLTQDHDVGLKTQATDVLKILLDPNAGSNNGPTLIGINFSNNKMEAKKAFDFGKFIDVFYGNSAKDLFAYLIELSKDDGKVHDLDKLWGRSLYEQLCELLSFCIRSHGAKCRDFTIETQIWKGLKKLIRASAEAKQVRLAAVRLLKQGLSMDDPLYMNEFIVNGLIGSVLDDLLEIGNRNNLVHSSCLDLLTMIEQGVQPGSQRAAQHQHKQNMRLILNHIAEKYSDKLRELEYTGVAKRLLERHLQSPTAMYAEHMNSIQTEDDNGYEAQIFVGESEGDFFDFSDDDDEHDIEPQKRVLRKPEPSKLSRMVEYFSDDDDDDIDDDEGDEHEHGEKSQLFNEDNKDLPFVPVGSQLLLQREVDSEEGHDVLKAGTLKRQQSLDMSISNPHESKRGPRRRRTSDNFTDEILRHQEEKENKDGHDDKKQGNDTDDDDNDNDNDDDDDDDGDDNHNDNDDEDHDDKDNEDKIAKKKAGLRRTLTTAGKKLSLKFKKKVENGNSTADLGHERENERAESNEKSA